MSYNSYYKGGSRGRGYGSRGSFRGRGDSGSGRGRPRGRFSWYKERSSGFDSRNRYLSGGGGGGPVRYSGYRRLRGDELDYPRERYHRSRSIDLPRKRIRSEHSYLQISDDDDDDLIEGETPIKKKVKKAKKEKTASKEDVQGEEAEEGEEGEKEGEEKEKNNTDANNTKDQDSDAKSESEEDLKKSMYDLSCPHCFTQCDTVQEYKMHLYSTKHINAMRKQSFAHKQTLQRMRMNQRQKQRIIEETDEFRNSLSSRSKFCPICKLNYKQAKSTHMTSEDHEEMVKFLNPYCRICKQRFNTPMFYEHHLCSLDHIKFKALFADKSKSDEEDGGKEDEKELNLDNFMILDSVGSVDETGEEGESGGEEKAEKEKDKDKEKEKDKEKGEESKTKPKSKPEPIIGAEYARKVEVFYCELCHHYLHWYEDQEKALASHCRTRSHLQRYVRHREDRLLRKEAERLYQKKLAKRKAEKEARAKKAAEKKEQSEDKAAENTEKSEKEGEKSSEDTAGESPKKKKKVEDGSEVSQGESQAAEGTGQEQDQDLEDLEKEIDGILEEVEDEDEDSRGRYDRFQNSEKGGAAHEEDESKVTAEEEQAAEQENEGEKPSELKSEPQSPTKKTSASESATSPSDATTN